MRTTSAKSVVWANVPASLISVVIWACAQSPAETPDVGADVGQLTDSSQDVLQPVSDPAVSDVGSDSQTDPFGSEEAIDPLPCRPNLDGRIESHEFQAVVGVPASFRVSPEGAQRNVDTVGAEGEQGWGWDWSNDDTDDTVIQNVASSVAAQWFAEHFPTGEFSTSITRDSSIVGIYAQDTDTVTLLGVASAESEPTEGQTLLIYDEPIVLYQFPIEPDQMWISTGEVRNGTYRGLPYAGRDIYEVHVISTGALSLPDLTFNQVHLIATRVTMQPAVGASNSIRQVSFVFECYGEVARAVSRDNETDEQFSIATEVRRLGL